jgi:hypothetical protein
VSISGIDLRVLLATRKISWLLLVRTAMPSK